MSIYLDAALMHRVTLSFAEFSNDAEFNSGFNLKVKVTLDLSIILRLILSTAFDAGFHTEHHSKL